MLAGASAVFIVNRTAGTYYNVSVDWSISPHALLDPPYAGTVQFAPGQSWSSIEVFASANSLPSLPQTYTLQLANVQGGAILGPNVVESLTLGSNDSPYGIFYLPSNPSLQVASNGFAFEMIVFLWVSIA